MESSRYQIAFISLLSVIAFSSLFLVFNQTKPSLTVVGLGNLSVKPGQVSLVVTRATLGNTAEESINQGELIMTKLIETTTKIAGADTEIKKSFYQVTPQNDGKFLMANAISIKSPNVSTTDSLIKSLYNNGATTVSNVTFDPKDNGEAEKKLRDNALIDAQKKATDMAKSMGKKIGRIISVAQDSANISSSVGEGNFNSTDISSINMDKKISVVYELR